MENLTIKNKAIIISFGSALDNEGKRVSDCRRYIIEKNKFPTTVWFYTKIIGIANSINDLKQIILNNEENK